MSKYKHMVIGFIVGAFVFSVIPIKAAVQEYILTKSDCSLSVNGENISDVSLPMLNYNGYNYIPVATLKNVAAKIGAEFKFINETKQIQLNTQGVKSVTSTIEQVPSTNEVNLSQWIGITDLRKYGIEVEAGGEPFKIWIRSGSKELIFNLNEMPKEDNQILTVNSNLGEFEILYKNQRSYLKIEDLKRIGFIE